MHNTPEGKLDKNGNPLRFCRDHDSDWLVQKDTPHYGLKEYASVLGVAFDYMRSQILTHLSKICTR
jgi:hypothetical protein